MATVLSVSGSPSASSRTSRLLRHLDERLTAQGHDVIPLDVRTIPAEALLGADFRHPAIVEAADLFARADGVVVGTPVYNYLTWGEPPAQVAEKLDRIRSLAAAEGRTLRFGIRLHVITRDTAEQAWAEANRLLDGFDPETVASVQAGLARSESEGQRRMLALHKGGSRERLEIHPNLWAGIGLVRGGAGTALVGSHEEVAERIKEYHALGIDEFILSGYPHLEEAYWFGEGVLPKLQAQGLWQHPVGEQAAPSAQIPFAGAGSPR